MDPGHPYALAQIEILHYLKYWRRGLTRWFISLRCSLPNFITYIPSRTHMVERNNFGELFMDLYFLWDAGAPPHENTCIQRNNKCKKS